MMTTRTTFLVGRLTPRSAEMVVVDDPGASPPIPGPWTLKAVVRVPVRPHRHAQGSQAIH